MSVEAAGYEFPQRQPGPRRWAAAAAAGFLGFNALAFLWFRGIAGSSGGWVIAAAVTGAVAAATGFAIWGPYRGRLRFAASLAVAGLLLGSWAGANAIWSHDRLEDTFEGIAMPDGLELRESIRHGNGMCFDECSAVIRSYTAPGTQPEWERRVEESLRRQGFSPQRWKRAGHAANLTLRRMKAQRGDLEMTVETSADTVSGLVAVELSLSGT